MLFRSANGTLVMNGGAITTSGAQSYGDAVTLGANTSLTGGAIQFVSTVDSAADGTRSLTITDSGATRLDGAVGNSKKLSSLMVTTANLTFDRIQTTGNVTIVNSGTQQLGDLDVGGNLNVTTGSAVAGSVGGISQRLNSVLTVAGNSIFTANKVVAQDALLNQPGNNFVGTVAFNDTNGGSWRAINVADSVGSLHLANVTATGQVTVSAVGNITQTGTLRLGGNTTITSTTGNVTLTDANNDFGGPLNLSGANVSVVDEIGRAHV